MSQSPGSRLSRRRFIQLGAAAGAAGLAGALGYGMESAHLPAPFPTPDGASEPTDAASPVSDAPLLLAINTRSDNPYGRYLGEILRAEGLNGFRVARLDALDRDYLSRFAVVLLSEGRLSADEAALLEGYVAAGGALIAMRPDQRLAKLMGVVFTGGRTSDGYIQTVAGHPACQGIATGNLQFHGEAERVRLAGAAPIAWLVAGNGATSDVPAITAHVVGRGKAVYWGFDLARSVALTRQGNPAWADQERDGLETIRACDMFKGWIDLDRIALPQADEQQRLLANIIQDLGSNSLPFPRLWYLPAEGDVMLVLTGDAHSIETPVIADMLARVERYGGRMSIYYTPPQIGSLGRMAQKARWWAMGLPVFGSLLGRDVRLPAPSEVAAWRERGHEFGMHPFVDAGLEEGYNACWNLFVKLGYGPVAPTTRTHRTQWFGWVENARVQARYGIGMNLDYYHVGPAFRKPGGEWAYGQFTGSGLPMKFVDQVGTILDVYQQNTQLVDERLLDVFGGKQDGLSAEAAVEVSKQLMESNLGHYPTALGVQCHVDPFQIGGPRAETLGRWLDGTLEHAASRSIPVVSAQEWLAFTEARRATRIDHLTWDRIEGRLAFDVTIPHAWPAGLELMIPARHAERSLRLARVDGAEVAHRERVVGGVRYATIRLDGANHTVQGYYSI